MSERRACILVVEDDPFVRMVIVDDLHEVGLDAEEAGSAAEAVEKLQGSADEIRAAIVDIGLPGLRGDALVAELRESHPHLPIVIASGYAEDDLRRQFGDDEMVAILGKPFEIDGLGAVLRRFGVLESGKD